MLKRNKMRLFLYISIIQNTFGPEQPLTYPQVGKFMVNILGYSNIVNSNNIYAYSMLAGSIGVFENVDSSKEYVSWKDALIIAHNALDIDLMTRDFGMIGDNYHVVEGKTLRTSLSTTTGQRVQKLKGILTADATTYLPNHLVHQSYSYTPYH